MAKGSSFKVTHVISMEGEGLAGEGKNALSPWTWWEELGLPQRCFPVTWLAPQKTTTCPHSGGKNSPAQACGDPGPILDVGSLPFTFPPHCFLENFGQGS